MCDLVPAAASALSVPVRNMLYVPMDAASFDVNGACFTGHMQDGTTSGIELTSKPATQIGYVGGLLWLFRRDILWLGYYSIFALLWIFGYAVAAPRSQFGTHECSIVRQLDFNNSDEWGK